MAIKVGGKQDIDSAIAAYIEAINSDGTFRQQTVQYIERKQELIGKFIGIGKSEITEPACKLTVLRKWNSYTPVLPSGTDSFSNKGGGYFLRVYDYGIVVDPGYNFIENFMNAGFKLDDIDSVFISHAHNDHTVELESIFSLLFKRNKSCDIANVKKIRLFVNLGTFKKFSGYFDLSNPDDKYYIEEIIILNKHQTLSVTESIKVFVSDVSHHEMISQNYAVGFIFEISDENNKKIATIKFTCDTGWSTTHQDKNLTLCRDTLSKIDADNGSVDILVAHIGSIKSNEFDYDCSKTFKENEDFLYDNHLGMIGCLAVIHSWRPGIVLLSEFGQEMDATREKIAKMFTETLRTNVVATDINFNLDLVTKKIMCFRTRSYYEFYDIKTYNSKSQLYYIGMKGLDEGEKLDIPNQLGDEIKVF